MCPPRSSVGIILKAALPKRFDRAAPGFRTRQPRLSRNFQPGSGFPFKSRVQARILLRLSTSDTTTVDLPSLGIVDTMPQLPFQPGNYIPSAEEKITRAGSAR